MESIAIVDSEKLHIYDTDHKKVAGHERSYDKGAWHFDINHYLQRCIAVDIRYILFIIDKLGGCGHLIDEMTIVE